MPSITVHSMAEARALYKRHLAGEKIEIKTELIPVSAVVADRIVKQLAMLDFIGKVKIERSDPDAKQ